MSATTRRMLPTFSWPGLAAFLPGSTLARVVEFDRRWREREAVRLLDDHLLRDIGVTRGDLEAALSRPEEARLLRRENEIED
ncbi:DUF1127 domain-containing protein [Amaricoccus sp.]|uniref:DUF1127 domain-containing protein n=1 Tax=Amaricoccus sp. TaxID=1872485 RepID=UPI001B52E8AB|nr:DUF1127 domain-containing protein [Amaricoccus sp.]MBP7241104.1 DUF1127 domain-containing protein [Amaricoccus sp.]